MRKLIGFLPTAAYMAIILFMPFQAVIFQFDGDILIVMGQAFALFAISVLAMQVFLTARLRFLDRLYGMDRLIRFHRKMGLVAMFVGLAHPLLIAAGYKSPELLLSFDVSLPVLMGKVTLLLLILVVLFALLFRKFRVDYVLWRRLHKGAILIVLLGAMHGLAIGDNLSSGVLRIFAITLIGIALLLFLWRNLVKPFSRKHYRIVSNQRETHDTWTIRMKPEGKPIERVPGQFAFITMLGKPKEEHPFTIADVTPDNDLVFTIKESGDFTKKIGDFGKNTEVLVDGGYGRFNIERWKAQSFIFIAGGVGITPVMAMLRHLERIDDTRPRMLFFANKTEQDILFRDELKAMDIKTVHLLSRQKDMPETAANETMLSGRLSAEIITAHSEELIHSADVYLCGPPPMMEATLRILHALGIQRSRIHFEKFSMD